MCKCEEENQDIPLSKKNIIMIKLHMTLSALVSAQTRLQKGSLTIWKAFLAETCRWTVAVVAHHPTLFLGQIHSRCHSRSCNRSRDHSHAHGKPGTSPPPGPGSRKVLSFCHTAAPEHNQTLEEIPCSTRSTG